MPGLQRPYFVVCLLLFSTAAATTSLAGQLELHDGDRVVFLGDGLIEQEQYFGWIEVMMTTAYPERNIAFRNLGWNGDTPAGKSRFGLSLLQAGREPEDEGWKQLQKQLELTKPTLLVLGYGMASALEDSAAGVDEFLTSYQRLLAKAKVISPDVRFLFLSPIQHLDRDSPHSRTIQQYAESVKVIAAENGSPFVDLTSCARATALRKDPIHLNDRGYRAVALEIADQLQFGNKTWNTSDHVEVLREVILRKNRWWFHRSRPANMAYVFGFRRHEQGQNAAEIPAFDKLIAEEEHKIARLRRLQPIALPMATPRLASTYAEFTEQPIPQFSVAEDLEITLWAQNPDLHKPIHMNFDPKGRLWIASSEAYPMIEVGQSAPDKIIVLEDTTGDGKADASSVFAEGLLIPTGVAPGDGGVYVAQSTDLLHLSDTDGDGKADVRRRVLSGFGTEDTHHNLHTLRWGPDGRLYMNQSVYTRTDAETPHGVVRLKAGGGFRYDTRTMRMEIFFRGLWNSWGHQFDDFGRSFLTDGAGFSGVAYSFPGATFRPTPKARHQLGLISPGNWPKFASLEIIGGGTFPPSWQGSFITCDFRANRVTRFSLSEQDAGFVTKQEADLVRTSAATFRPIDVKQGPDGALYIADWSNPIINHGEVDFRDPRRDRWHGRIWRVAWKDAKPKRKIDLTSLDVDSLLDSLKSDDRYTRDQARRVLVERGEEIEAGLADWLAEQTSARTRLQALWLYQALDLAAGGLLDELLGSDNADVRTAATRVLSAWADRQSQPQPLLGLEESMVRFAKRVRDEHPRVRLEAVRGLARLGTAAAGSLALEVLDQPMDRFLEHALALTIEELSDPLMEAIEDGPWQANSARRDQQLALVLTSVDPSRARRYLSRRLAREPIARDGSGPWIELVGKIGNAAELSQLYSQAIAGRFDQAATVRALRSLVGAARLRRLHPTSGLEQIGTLVLAAQQDVQLAAIELVGVWKLNSQVTPFEDLASSPTSARVVREASISALVAIGSEQAAQVLAKLATAADEPPVRHRAVAALARLHPEKAVAPFFSNLSKTASEAAALELWRGVLSSGKIGEHLINGLANQDLQDFAVTAGLRAAQEAGRNDPKLISALTLLSGAAGPTQLTKQRIEELVRLVPSGSPERGEMIYRRKDLACVTCHAIGGVGGKVGPDMTSLGASAPIDYLIESLFDPNAKIKEGFHSLVVVTEGGQVVSGVETDSNETELVLRDATNKIIRIPRAEIAERRTGLSLMPSGVVDRLSQQEQVDLLHFLAQLGKPGDYDASQGGVARSFEILAGNHRIEQQGASQIVQGEITEGWKPVQALVRGDVPGSLLKELTKQPSNISLVNVYLRTNVEATSEGEIVLTVPAKAAMWLDGRPLQGDRKFTARVRAGRHQVLVRLDARDLPKTFRLESNDVVFLAGD